MCCCPEEGNSCVNEPHRELVLGAEVTGNFRLIVDVVKKHVVSKCSWIGRGWVVRVLWGHMPQR
jgi:hypothetical protein